MYWYHGSNRLFTVLRRRRPALMLGVPKEEVLNMIYLTPDFAFALVMAARPEGITDVYNNRRLVRFENPDSIEPKREVYIYFVNPDRIPDSKKIWIDEWQIAADLDKLKPDRVEKREAGELWQYYRTFTDDSQVVKIPNAVYELKQEKEEIPPLEQ